MKSCIFQFHGKLHTLVPNPKKFAESCTYKHLFCLNQFILVLILYGYKKNTLEIFDADGEDEESLVEDFGKLKLGSEATSNIIE